MAKKKERTMTVAAPVVLNGIKANVTMDPETGKGFLRFKFADTTIVVSNDDGRLGEICGCLGGGLELQHVDDEKEHGAFGSTYFIEPEELWNAFTRAREERDR